MRLVSFVLTSIAAVVAFSALPAFGKPHNNDYYSVNLDRGLLNTVETYHLGPGIAKMKVKRYEVAKGDFDFILNYFPNHPQVLILMAELCEAWKSPKCDIQAYFDRAIDRNPNVAETFVIAGIYQERAKRTPQAIESFKRALAIEPNSVNANYNIALAYLDSGQYELANAHAQKAYALGAPLEGLRERLQRAGHWQPLAPSATEPAKNTMPGSSSSQTDQSAGPNTSSAK